MKGIKKVHFTSSKFSVGLKFFLNKKWQNLIQAHLEYTCVCVYIYIYIASKYMTYIGMNIYIYTYNVQDLFGDYKILLRH